MSTQRERTAGRLLKASAERSYDPVCEIDWDAELADDLFYCPQHRSTLYGTRLWDRLTHTERVVLTRHEVAALASIGIWFETILMQMLVRHTYDRDATSNHVQYALTEIADECRHSVMFGKMISKFGCRYYRPGRLHHNLGRIFKTVARGPQLWAAALLVEEVLDALQREAMADDSLQPLVRAVSWIHVVEEARHVRFAREELLRQVARAGPAQMAVSRLIIARAAYVVGTNLVHPRAYADAGLDPREAYPAAKANPHRQATMAWAASKLVAFFTELGLIKGPGTVLWRKSGFLVGDSQGGA